MLTNISDYHTEIQEADRVDLPLRNKYIHLKQVLERVCKDITASETLQFPSLFSRLVYISQKINIPRTLEWQLQNIRVKANFLQRNDQNIVTHNQYQRAKDALNNLLLWINGNEIREDNETDESDKYELTPDRLRVQVLGIDESNKHLICRAEIPYEKDIFVRYDILQINDIFSDTIKELWIGAQLNLIDAKQDEEGYYVPKAFVLEPDYLIDASAMAECFQQYSTSHLHYFRRKFEQPINSHYILLGNLANFFLDELIYADNLEDIRFEDTFLKSFRSMPFEYASCQDIADKNAFMDFMRRARIQFDNIKRVISHDLPHNGFDTKQCILEPSFYSEKYGFQGRLDLLQPANDESDLFRIIELKSGKPPYPFNNTSLIGRNHEVQTTVYRLMIQSVWGVDARHIYPAILYSSVESEGQNVRLAAPYKQLEKEILNTRNLIVATEHKLYTGSTDAVQQIFDELFYTKNYGQVPDFFLNKLNDIKKVLDKATKRENLYFCRYIAFISRELYLQKAGDEGYNNAISTAALWNTTFEERKESLDLIDKLAIEEIDTDGRDMKITFSRENSSDCVNFREGEICILYPRQKENDTLLTNQILKGNIVEISSERVILRFRYKQRNLSFFNNYKYWVVEHDKLDHSYNSMFKSLFAFMMANKDKKDLLMGMRRPETSLSVEDNEIMNTKQKQEHVIRKALSAEDYFLIVGPPGTGKTSIFARRLIEEIHKNADAQILVIAYTNKAVDELCEAICSAFCSDSNSCDGYIRIGTELSCGEPYRRRLLQNISQGVNSRKELLDILNTQRIFIGTLASIVGKPEILGIKKFNVAIIDEASQILEPQIIGLLPLIDKFIMIGDHKQLATITLQNEDKSKVTEQELNDIGLYDCRESLFERLFRICQENGWKHAYDILTFHGRMHQDIADFVNRHFYDNQLIISTDRQNEPLTLKNSSYSDKHIYNLIESQRVAFISSNIQNNYLYNKTNEEEAYIATEIAKNLIDIYKINGLTFEAQKTLGIITPYRNQIALIKQKIEETGVEELKHIMIDTVERFQGSQRDVIIVSFCFNSPYQLRYFANMDREQKVDRKLNVALTRAREQLFLIGNEKVMRQNPIYNKLLDSIPIMKNSDL